MPDKRRLDESAEWTGQWWLPEEPDRVVPGVLRYDPKSGLLLDLIGGFEDRILQQVRPGLVADQGVRTWPMILGVADNMKVTLLDCWPGPTKSYGMRLAGPHKQIIGAMTGLIGVHLSDLDDAIFTQLRVSVEDLGQWSSSSVFAGAIGLTDNAIDGTGSISVSPVEEPTVLLDGIKITLAHEHTLPHFDQLRGETVARMRDTVFVRFEPESPYTLSTARDHAQAIQDLVSLATHRGSGLLWMQLRLAPGTSNTVDEHPQVPRDVSVYTDSTVPCDADARAVDHHNVLFTCAHVPFADAVSHWWATRQELRSAVNMVLGLRYAPARYLESNLLTAVGAAEVLHRALGMDTERIPQAEFKALRAALVACAPDGQKTWVKEAIRNDITLRERLRHLAARPSSEAMELLVPDVEEWARLATNSRNDLAHTGRTTRHSLDELIAVVRVTTAVVTMNLLHELGVPEARQLEVVRDNPDLRHTAKLAAEHLTDTPSS
ncbi:MAG: hypothetical protein IPG94_07395 [Kineosporiaceae bacterium]|nr:hypothetical protein [Kineosporiaceae bacterium]